MADRKATEELNEAELDQVTGGAGHEVSHTVQQGSSKVASVAGGNPDGLKKVGNKKGIVASGGGSDI